MREEEDGSYLRNGHSPDILRKLRRMYWTIEDEADLHGLTEPEAADALDAFIAEAREHGMRCVRVIHGKGTGVLRRSVRRSLSHRDDVVAFVEPPAAQGGGGAVVVLLRG